MTERVYLHVGTPKSGTTYLQRVLDHNRERLAAAGVLVVGDEHVDRVHAALVVREDPRVRTLPPRQTPQLGQAGRPDPGVEGSVGRAQLRAVLGRDPRSRPSGRWPTSPASTCTS